MKKQHISKFTTAMVAACEAALKAGVFAQNLFHDYVLTHMGGFDCSPWLLEIASIECSSYQYEKQYARLTGLVSASPRGSYAVICRTQLDGKLVYTFLASDGSGQLAVGGSYNLYDVMPTGEEVIKCMMAYEIYECRQVVHRQCKLEANVNALKECPIYVGMEFKNFTLPGDRKPIARAIISYVDTQAGKVELTYSRRGTHTKMAVMLGAKDFLVAVGLLQTESTDFKVSIADKIDELFEH